MKVGNGVDSPLGVSFAEGRYNFAILSTEKKISLILYASGNDNRSCSLIKAEMDKVGTVIPLDPVVNRTKNIWHVSIEDYDLSVIYTYSVNENKAVR